MFFISKGGAEEPSHLQAHKPLPHTLVKELKIAVEVKDPTHSPRAGIKPLRVERNQQDKRGPMAEFPPQDRSKDTHG
eukprot:6585172-Ditylum_brightwellii.AAC.1